MLVEQRIVIIGGASGIGFEIARRAADRGAEVILGGSRPERLEAARGKITGKVLVAPVDVRDEASIEAFFRNFGEVDHVISTVGAALAPASIADTDTAGASTLWQIKYWGQLLVAKHATPHLVPGGSLVLTSGILSQRPARGFGVLASVNAAIEALVRTLALELSPQRANAVSPGFIDSGKLHRELPAAEREAALYTEKAASLPARVLGRPEHAAAAYFYAIENPYVTGQTLFVEGGAALL